MAGFFAVPVWLVYFDAGFHLLDGFVQFFEVEEVGAGAAVVDDFAVFAHQVQAFRGRP